VPHTTEHEWMWATTLEASVFPAPQVRRLGHDRWKQENSIHQRHKCAACLCKPLAVLCLHVWTTPGVSAISHAVSAFP
jgi:hypothetical protein